MSLECYYYNKHVLITGGAGFIGSHLAEQLIACGAKVTILDNFSTGSIENLVSIKSCITLIEGDIKNYTTCLMATHNIDYVFHLAAFTVVSLSFEKPQECFETNVTGTFNILEASRVNKVKRLVFSSSCAVYGDNESVSTEASQCHPGSPYAYSKLIGEQYCQQYARLFGLNSIALRYFNVFGERQNPQDTYAGVVTKFSSLIKNNQPITIFGNGQQTRDFVPVSVVIEANMTLALLSAQDMQGQAVNIATGRSSTIIELFESLRDRFNYAIEPQFAPARPGDIISSQASCLRYQHLIKKVRACSTF